MDCLLNSKIKKVTVIGRRGPIQVAFTIKEFREMLKLRGCSTVMSPCDFEGIPELIPSIYFFFSLHILFLIKCNISDTIKTKLQGIA